MIFIDMLLNNVSNIIPTNRNTFITDKINQLGAANACYNVNKIQ